MSNYLILLSGGSGTRMKSDIPKQYLTVKNKTILEYTIDCFDFDKFKNIVLVISDTWKSEFVSRNQNSFWYSKILFAAAGNSRQESILNGMERIKDFACEDDFVVIHDAARPCLSKTLVENLLEMNKTCDGVMPVLPVKDTIYMSENGKKISSLLNRDQLFSGQSPESFKFKKYYEINTNLSKIELEQIRGSSEIAFRNNLTIKMIDGDEGNFKITTPIDLERFKEIIERRI